MRINAINGSSSVYARKNKVYSQPRNVVQNGTENTQTQNVNFKGNVKIALTTLGAIAGGLIIGGPIGAIIGAAAGFKGGQIAEEDEEIRNSSNEK